MIDNYVISIVIVVIGAFLPASSSVHMYAFIHYTYVQVAIIRPLCIPYIAIVNIVLYMKSSSTANACMGK